MKFKLIAAVAACAAIAGCATTVADAEMSERAKKRLAEFDRTGDISRCLPLRSVNQITPLDERYFLVRVGVNNFYLNKVSGQCAGAHRANNRIQYVTSLSQLCRNEIIRVVDNLNNFTVGSCGLGSFERLEKKPDEETEDA